MNHIDFIKFLIKNAINLSNTNEDISDLIGILETTHLDALDKREAIKEIE